jgi:hypothetical protein
MGVLSSPTRGGSAKLRNARGRWPHVHERMPSARRKPAIESGPPWICWLLHNAPGKLPVAFGRLLADAGDAGSVRLLGAMRQA